MTDPFLASVLKLFYDNSSLVTYFENEIGKQYIVLKVYRPFEEKGGFVKLSGFKVVIECFQTSLTHPAFFAPLNARLKVYELSLGRMATLEPTIEPIDQFYLKGSKEYELIQKLIDDMAITKAKEKEDYLESVKQEFIKGQLTFADPVEAYVEHINKERTERTETTSYSREPEMLSFDVEEDFEDDDNDGG